MSEMASEEWIPDFFWVGPTKAASTWVYRCCREHPDIFVNPDYDAIHYYNLNYFRGKTWYRAFFTERAEESVAGDFTPSYLYHRQVPARIYRDNPEGKILICLRNPIERAFSHYWHLKSRNRISWDFEQLFEIHELYKMWIKPGFYDWKLKRYLEFFSRSQIKIFRFSNLKKGDESFIKTVFETVGVNPDFKPSLLGEKVNKAGPKRLLHFKIFRKINDLIKRLGIYKKDFPGWLIGQKEYNKGIDRNMFDRLLNIYEPHITELEKMLGEEFPEWREYSSGDS